MLHVTQFFYFIMFKSCGKKDRIKEYQPTYMGLIFHTRPMKYLNPLGHVFHVSLFLIDYVNVGATSLKKCWIQHTL
jgi:hypothetical protein